MTAPAKNFTATALIDKDGIITAFYDEMPGLMVQGTSRDDIAMKLDSVLVSYIKYLSARKNGLQIETKYV